MLTKIKVICCQKGVQIKIYSDILHLSKLYKERVAKGEMSNPVMYGEANPKSKRVSVLGVEYASGLSADKALGLTPQSTTYRCNSQSKKCSNQSID